MSKEIEVEEPEMLPEYDFSGGVRRAYASRYAQSNSVVMLEPDVFAAFPTSEVANEALRLLMRVAQQTVSGKVLRK